MGLLQSLKRGIGHLNWKIRGVLGLRPSFTDSASYWDARYALGGTSGAGSYGRLAVFKAEVLNAFAAEQGVRSVIEFGCGDGHQLTLATYPSYLGLDVSARAVEACRQRFAGDPYRQFAEVADYDGQRAELALSLDVIYHLVEDEVFDVYMRRLFCTAERFVVVYASNTDVNDHGDPHVRHRRFTDWVEANLPEWRLLRHLPNRYPFEGDDREGSFADFYFYERA